MATCGSCEHIIANWQCFCGIGHNDHYIDCSTPACGDFKQYHRKPLPKHYYESYKTVEHYEDWLFS